MKKKIMLVLIAVLAIVPFMSAKAAVVQSNLAEAVAEEIAILNKDTSGNYDSFKKTLKKFDASKYTPGKAKVTVYIFRGDTCPHCLEAVTYFSSIYSKYKDKIDVQTYEVYNNSDNASLMKQVASEMGVSSNGVPLIIIGEKTFSGYGESLNEEILEAIDNAYNDKDYQDAVQGIINGTYEYKGTKEESTDKKNSDLVGYIVLGATAVIIVLIIVGRMKSNSYYEDTSIEEMEEAIEKEEDTEELKEEVKTTTKKTTTTKKPAAKKTTKKKVTKKK